ncbi:glycosyl transferase [Hoeflea sp. BAL378]|uniref:GH36-type glycosyl hydrolase domain-containing protein n=1 Tax=Hoeflea sp. BAL378 TaxID=1547437 RepID=UPI000512C4BD|nr:glucoamylase family protein [Hoeflea sp. BAL378]KGF70808.1 glycosyl transferase [Hoeflea sp. BAL378]
MPAGWRRAPAPPWNDEAVIRADLFGAERLEHHAISLAKAQPVTEHAVRVLPLSTRVRDNSKVLLSAYRSCTQALAAGQTVTPATEWLLDNYHMVERQLEQIARDLPPGYYRQLPKLATGPFAGYPRVLGIVWAYVAHTDSLLNGPVFARFVRAYQTVDPLTIGELWALAITLRIVLIENMRRLAEQIISAQRMRLAADELVDRVMSRKASAGSPYPAYQALAEANEALDGARIPEIMAARIAQRLRGFDTADTPLHDWLQDRLGQQGLTMDDVVEHAQFRQGASNVTMRNIVTSMRLIAELEWPDFFEEVSLVDARLRQGSDFAAMDFATRDLYRTEIELLARGSGMTEVAVAEAALTLAASGDTPATRDPGHCLIGPGRSTLEHTIGYRPGPALRLRRTVGRFGLGGYLLAIGLASFLILWASMDLAVAQTGAPGWLVVILALAMLGPAFAAASALVNLAVTRTVAPRRLPGMDLVDGIPPELRSLVVVPVLLDTVEDLAGCIERLEVHHLSSTGGALHYAILSDGPDSATETRPQDAELIAEATRAIARLNAAYPSPEGDRFLFLHRHRLWNPSMGVWMGWERKRGKLIELNRLLRGADDTSFMAPCAVPKDVRFVITLDADTRLLRDTVRRLIGKLAHPLNAPHVDPDLGWVTQGYGILQPRVTPALPVGGEGSLYQQINASHGGIDAYASAISDVYQDLFGEGSFTGKGIYDVDAFEAALEGRIPDNTMLSHDLFEGNLARAALVSDIEVVEDFPARYDVSARRQHRWVRGDWQLLPWLAGLAGRSADGRSPVFGLGRWKIIDNLRRSLTAPLTLAALAAGWLLPFPAAALWTAMVLAMLALPFVLPLPFALLPGRAGITAHSHLAALAADAWTAMWRIAMEIMFLPDTAARMADAILRTAWRLGVSRRNLLEWVTAAQAARSRRPGVAEQYRFMAAGVALGGAVTAAAAFLNPSAWPVILPFALAWLASPVVAHRISRPSKPREAERLGVSEIQSLRLIGRSTWRFFETFVSTDDNDLPPDNFQETPQPMLARRTSPTNIGLYLLATTAAHDLGWIGRAEAVSRLERTLATVQRMPKFRGHLYNWYATDDLRVLEPDYVSSVDSGNLAGHLIAVAQACAEWQREPAAEADWRAGLADCLLLAECAFSAEASPEDEVLASLLGELVEAASRQAPLDRLLSLSLAAATQARSIVQPDSEAGFWIEAVHNCLAGHAADRDMALAPRLAAVEKLARDLALAMDFAFLLDRDKKLLSIGFSVTANQLDPSCYDLLASEARLASLFAIAKGDVETRHWFRLGRAATPLGAGSALISWSGSMFEYLMPSLVLRAPEGSVLAETNRRIVDRQRSYGTMLDIPWGISESSYNARDLEMTYQYSNFGVPGLGLKRGLSENRVVAPYATGLAAMVAPVEALKNYKRLSTLGAEGRFGFYEAVDFTASRLPTGTDFAVIRSFMAHHQGMTITAIANCVQGGRLRSRFHAEPMIKAVDLLLQERVPRDANEAPPRAEEMQVAAHEPDHVPAVRPFPSPATAAPTAHLLSNGTYGVMLTPTGAGFSRWRGLAVTRWRDDPTTAGHGSYILARDRVSGSSWSAALQPSGADPESHQAVFSEHQAAFTHQRDKLKTHTEMVVSAEDDAEARRVTLTNTGQTAREIDLTSYAELVLAPLASDIAHQAFSKMFVVTDFLPELGVLIATRRRRSPSDPEVWAAHIAVVEGTEAAPIQFETDRARFIGAGRSLASAAMAQSDLSQTTGTVLDPIFAIRRSVTVPAGGMARVTFWTIVADDPEILLHLVDRHRDPSAFDRAVTLAWTKAQVQLRHLGMTQATATDFQRLGGMLVRGDAGLRAPAASVITGAAPQSSLWPHGISGDLPIILFRIEDAEDAPKLLEVLAAHEFLRMRQLAVDLVILNDRSASYVQDLQTRIEQAVRSAGMRPRAGTPSGRNDGAVHVLRRDLIPADSLASLVALASVVLVARRGSIGQQIDAASRPVVTERPALAASRPAFRITSGSFDASALEFFNGTGGFAEDGREYVVALRGGQTTPAPWINVIANPGFGFQVSALGSGHVWAENSRENQLTPWSNDPVTDPPGEAVYLHDLDSGHTWTPTALPIRDGGLYVARHGFGYSQFEHSAHGIDSTMVQFVPMDDPVRITRLTLGNSSDRVRSLSVTTYAEWVLGPSRGATARHIITSLDSETGAILARNPYSTAFPGRFAFADLGAETSSLSADRAEVLGTGGSMAAPAGIGAEPLSGRTGPLLDPCAALQRRVTLQPGETIEIVALMGQAESPDAARELILRHRAADPAATLEAVRKHWHELLDAVQVTSPDRAMDIMLNGWLLYQTLACRIWARAGFYQASGAFGFRDQLQDGMALTALRPDMTRAHLLRAASRQFPEGDVQHWWLPHSGQGVRTRISDDRVWLGYAVAQYIAVSGDTAVLDEQVPFLEGPALLPGAHDDFFLPSVSPLQASLFEHCARGLDQAVELTGENGMPLIGTGDWNDGMNRVGEHGQGTSVWLGWLLITTIDAMAPFADARDPARALRWRQHATAVREAIERDGWDGKWYRRGTYDDGTLLGSATSQECRIDSLAQTWAVLSGAADPTRAATAMASMSEHLIRPDPGLALLFTPPFDASPQDPGYIKGYPPGLRENGGQYSHAAMWAILAQARLGDGDAAGALFSMLNPIHHALTPEDAARYKVEPYVVAADVYSTAPHEGRGGWTWYTGSAGWMYRAGIEGLLGLTRAGETLRLDPCFPKAWPEVRLVVRTGESSVSITIDNSARTGRNIVSAMLDGVALHPENGQIVLAPSAPSHRLTVRLG